jgi:hypothetical protein
MVRTARKQQRPWLNCRTSRALFFLTCFHLLFAPVFIEIELLSRRAVKTDRIRHKREPKGVPMDTRVPLASSHGMRRLAEFLRETGSTLTPAEAANEAIDEWIVRRRGRLPDIEVESTRGYRWKELLLPEGTLLRMHRDGSAFDARVTGSDLIFQGRPVSPHQMAVAVAGKGYNAWRTIWVLLPSLTRWQPAWRLRHNAELRAQRPTLSPQEALVAAAECMSDTLRSAMNLLDQVKAQARQPVDRRKERTPRATDGADPVLPDE